MQSEKRISVDGRLVTWRDSSLEPSMLMGQNWVYTTINTLAYKPLHLERKLHYALDSYKALFGRRPQLQSREVAQWIGDLLYYDLYPEGGNTLTLYLIHTPEGTTRSLVMHEATTPYEGYGLLALRPKAIIANYEIPFAQHQTNVSLTAARFADLHATSHGYGIALRANRAGTLFSSGDNPLFALRGDTLMTTPLNKGARPSTEREVMWEIAQRAGVRIIEEELKVEDVAEYDELMVFTPVGIQSVGFLAEQRLGNIYATLLGKQLPTLSLEALAR